MNNKRLTLNTFCSLLYEIVVIVSGFVLPRLILLAYGSEVNGILNSIAQFLGIITFLKMGVGAVVQSALYKPLAENDYDNTSKIVVSAQKFFRKIGYILLIYVVILIPVYPFITNSGFSWIYSATLILAISISSFAQYFFGVTDRLLLTADQRGYIQYNAQTITLALNTIACIILIKLGASIHMVKLTTSLIYLLRPIYLRWYINKHYKINRKIKYDDDPIKQKWNGFSQHFAAVVSEEIDVILLTLFASYSIVSIYSIYFLFIYGITQFVMTTVSGLESFWGNMLAKNEYKSLNKSFEIVEIITHIGVTILFVTAGITIASFVSVYTKGLIDASKYYLPLFGLLLTIAYASQCLRVPYYNMIKAAGHYKETQRGAFISMAINIILSIILVFKFNLVGVAIGTLVAMLYHTIYFAWYLRRNIIRRSFKYFVKHLIIDIIVGVICYLISRYIFMSDNSYIAWCIYTLKIVAIVITISIIVNLVFYYKEMILILQKKYSVKNNKINDN